MSFDMVDLFGCALAAFGLGISVTTLWFASSKRRAEQEPASAEAPAPQPITVKVDFGLLSLAALSAGFKLEPIQTHKHSNTVQ